MALPGREESDGPVDIQLRTPEVDELGSVVRVCGSGSTTARRCSCTRETWAGSGGSAPDALAAALRTWRSDGRIVAVGLLDGPDVCG